MSSEDQAKPISAWWYVLCLVIATISGAIIGYTSKTTLVHYPLPDMASVVVIATPTPTPTPTAKPLPPIPGDAWVQSTEVVWIYQHPDGTEHALSPYGFWVPLGKRTNWPNMPLFTDPSTGELRVPKSLVLPALEDPVNFMPLRLRRSWLCICGNGSLHTLNANGIWVPLEKHSSWPLKFSPEQEAEFERAVR